MASTCKGVQGGERGSGYTHTRSARNALVLGSGKCARGKEAARQRNTEWKVHYICDSLIRFPSRLRGDAAEETAGGRPSRASSVGDALDEVGGVACRRAGASGAAPGPRTGCSIMRLYTSSSSPHTSWPRVTPPLPPRPPWLSLLPSRSSCISSSYCSSLYLVLFSLPTPFFSFFLVFCSPPPSYRSACFVLFFLPPS